MVSHTTLKMVLKKPDEKPVTLVSHAEFSSVPQAVTYFAAIADNLTLTMALMPHMFHQTAMLEGEITSRQLNGEVVRTLIQKI